jgi:hypothetical protein
MNLIYEAAFSKNDILIERISIEKLLISFILDEFKVNNEHYLIQLEALADPDLKKTLKVSLIICKYINLS